ncbi:MAG: radical SAM protein [Acidobacteria bacterium]|nr:radical SAM protein [Acidobacteriota bacterium]
MDDTPACVDPLAEKHRVEFGDAYDLLNFVSEDEARRAKAFRNEILVEIASEIKFRNKRTKPVYRGISRGCELCGTGSWSCLFVNGKCNCRCFYCPAEQRVVGLPTTNTLTFPKVQDYVDYIGQFDFRGVSISGGEPLLTLDTTLKFITAVKRKFGDRTYLWIYTNGTLVDRDALARLRDAGINEIRFDIGATEYSLKKARLAVGLIDHVTVEIPAVPEDYDVLKGKLHEMSESGISFLNLHQLRLTPYNRYNLLDRNYTYLHGEHPTVLESELTALKLMRHAAEDRIPLALNYCSYVYKNRFQRAAARRRCGLLIRSPHEDVTENGYIRSLYVEGPADALDSLAESLSRSGHPAGSWRSAKEKGRFFFSSTGGHAMTLDNLRLGVAYYDSRLVQSISYRNPFKEIRLNRNRSIFAERTRASNDMEIPECQRAVFEALVFGEGEPVPIADMEGPLDQILRYETVEPDLQDYS